MFSFSSTGSFKNTEAYLKKMTDGSLYRNLSRYGKMGVDALADATPEDTGLAADSWGYRVIRDKSNPGLNGTTRTSKAASRSLSLSSMGTAPVMGVRSGRDYINPGFVPYLTRSFPTSGGRCSHDYVCREQSCFSYI